MSGSDDLRVLSAEIVPKVSMNTTPLSKPRRLVAIAVCQRDTYGHALTLRVVAEGWRLLGPVVAAVHCGVEL
jgi:hypothetical protein